MRLLASLASLKYIPIGSKDSFKLNLTSILLKYKAPPNMRLFLLIFAILFNT